MTKTLDRTTLKYIAVAAMLIDHTAAVFVPPTNFLYIVMRMVGRFTAPIMCYFLVEGFIHTSSVKKYIARTLLFAIVTQPAFSRAFHGSFFTANFNMLFTMAICLIMLAAYKSIENKALKILTVAVCIILTGWCDWAYFAPIWVLSFYIMREQPPRRKFIAYCITSLVMLFGGFTAGLVPGIANFVIHLGLVGALVLLFSYNGEPGKRSGFSKWFFYAFYPAHLWILVMIALVAG